MKNNETKKVKRENVEMSNKTRKIIVGFLSITISLAMIGYTACTIFNSCHTSTPKPKNKVMEKIKK